MKMKMIYSGIVSILLLAACDGQNTQNRNHRQNDTEGVTSGAGESVKGIFTTTHKDLEDDTKELKKEISELKEKLNRSDTTARQNFQQHLSFLDQGIVKLEGKVQEFKTASDDRKEEIKEEFEREEENLEERIKQVKDQIED